MEKEKNEQIDLNTKMFLHFTIISELSEYNFGINYMVNGYTNG